jgi:hypothetical protein
MATSHPDQTGAKRADDDHGTPSTLAAGIAQVFLRLQTVSPEAAASLRQLFERLFQPLSALEHWSKYVSDLAEPLYDVLDREVSGLQSFL